MQPRTRRELDRIIHMLSGANLVFFFWFAFRRSWLSCAVECVALSTFALYRHMAKERG